MACRILMALVVEVSLVLMLLLLPPPCRGAKLPACEEFSENTCPLRASNQGQCLCLEGYDKNDGSRELCCNFQLKTGSLRSTLIDKYHKVSVNNASKIEFYPTCDSPHQIVKFTNVELAEIFDSRVSNATNCNIEWDLWASDAYEIKHFSRLFLHRSRVDKVNLPIIGGRIYENISIFVMNSRIDVLSDIHFNNNITDPDQKIIGAHHSSIGKLFNVDVEGIANFHNSEIGSINDTIFQKLRMSQSIVDEINPLGLTLKQGLHSMVNVTLKHLKQHSVILEPDAELHLTNVRILKCSIPCIISYTPRSIQFDDVTVNGNLITSPAPPYFQKILQDHNAPDPEHVRADEQHCARRGELIECDFKNYLWPIEVSLDPEVSSTSISYGHDVTLSNPCYHFVNFFETSGRVLESSNDAGRFDNFHCDITTTQMAMQMSRMSYVISPYLIALDINKSLIGKLSLTHVRVLTLTDTRVSEIVRLNYETEKLSEELLFNDVGVGDMRDVSLSGSIRIRGLKIRHEIFNLSITDTPGNGPAAIIDSNLGRINENGLRILSGIVFLKKVYANLAQNAIDISDGGWLVFSEDQGPLHCPLPPCILVNRRSQVVFTATLLPMSLRDSIKVKSSDAFEGYNGYRSIKPADCKLEQYGTASCNLMHSQERFILGGTSYMDEANSVEVINADYLRVAEHCFNLIVLRHINELEFDGLTYSCIYDLSLESSSVSEIGSHVNELRVSNSSVVDIHTKKRNLKQGIVYNSNITNFHASIDNGQFINVHIKNISHLLVSNVTIFSNARIDRIEKIIVPENAEIIFVDCLIGEIGKLSLVIDGRLVFDRVRISVAKNHSILAHPTSEIVFRDLEVTSHVPQLVHDTTGLDVKLDTVTLGGKLISIADHFLIDPSEHLIITDLYEFEDKIGYHLTEEIHDIFMDDYLSENSEGLAGYVIAAIVSSVLLILIIVLYISWRCGGCNRLKRLWNGGNYEHYVKDNGGGQGVEALNWDWSNAARTREESNSPPRPVSLDCSLAYEHDTPEFLPIYRTEVIDETEVTNPSPIKMESQSFPSTSGIEMSIQSSGSEFPCLSTSTISVINETKIGAQASGSALPCSSSDTVSAIYETLNGSQTSEDELPCSFIGPATVIKATKKGTQTSKSELSGSSSDYATVITATKKSTQTSKGEFSGSSSGYAPVKTATKKSTQTSKGELSGSSSGAATVITAARMSTQTGKDEVPRSTYSGTATVVKAIKKGTQTNKGKFQRSTSGTATVINATKKNAQTSDSEFPRSTSSTAASRNKTKMGTQTSRNRLLSSETSFSTVRNESKVGTSDTACGTESEVQVTKSSEIASKGATKAVVHATDVKPGNNPKNPDGQDNLAFEEDESAV